MSREARRQLLQFLQAALKAVHGRDRVRAALMNERPAGPVRLVAIGKAAGAMTLGALDALGADLERGLVITKTGHLEPGLGHCSRLECMEAGHPLPDARSLTAGQRLLRFLDDAPDTVPLLFLISGGASSLVEVPREGITLDDLQRVNRWLLGSGLDIRASNDIRKRLSRIKGGQLLSFIGEHPASVLLMSDVPGDDPGDIGSGLLVPAQDRPLARLPAWLDALLPEPPARSSVVSVAPRIKLVASLSQAKEAAAAEAIAGGQAASVHTEDLSGEAADVGRALARELICAPSGVHIWGGETVVKLPKEPGRGGRNQTLALAAATELAGREDVLLLAVGTDGSDGPGTDAGGLVDGGTLARGGDAGLDADVCLAHADAGTFLAASGDLVDTGPTGTNVMDLVIGLKRS